MAPGLGKRVALERVPRQVPRGILRVGPRRHPRHLFHAGTCTLLLAWATFMLTNDGRASPTTPSRDLQCGRDEARGHEGCSRSRWQNEFVNLRETECDNLPTFHPLTRLDSASCISGPAVPTLVWTWVRHASRDRVSFKQTHVFPKLQERTGSELRAERWRASFWQSRCKMSHTDKLLHAMR